MRTFPVILLSCCVATAILCESAIADLPAVIVHNFSTAGYGPTGTLTVSGSTVYGTTSLSNSTEGGTVFRVENNTTGFSILHDFRFDPSINYMPEGRLTMVGQSLYGTTANGGINNSGTIFKVNTDGSGFGFLRHFVSGTGVTPEGSLQLVGSTLYGTTSFAGGINDTGGTIFRMDLDGSGYTVLHKFSDGGGAGYQPARDLALSGGRFYGTTLQGGSTGNGSVFSMNLDGTGFTVLHSFAAAGDEGRVPYGGLIISGATIFGTAMSGGGSSGGTIFSMQTDGSAFQVLHNFSTLGADGYQPRSELIVLGSQLYGTTELGGVFETPKNPGGTAFRLNLDGTGYERIHSFGGSALSPSQLVGGFTLQDSMLFGTTSRGGQGLGGTAYFFPVPEPRSWISMSIALAILIWSPIYALIAPINADRRIPCAD